MGELNVSIMVKRYFYLAPRKEGKYRGNVILSFPDARAPYPTRFADIKLGFLSVDIRNESLISNTTRRAIAKTE